MLWTAFTIGLFGSLHCVGMCGPIVLALPYAESSRSSQLKQVIRYNTGRILSYSLIGMLIGLLGLGARLAGIQSWISIGMGVILLIVAIWQIPLEQHLIRWPIIGRFQVWIRNQFALHWGGNTHFSFFKMGMLNGLLPCGLVYLAIVGALSMEQWSSSLLYMVLFGLGTFPMMAATVFIGQQSARKWKQKLWSYYPVLLGLVSVWLIMRGVRFNLPADYTLWQIMADMPMCH